MAYCRVRLKYIIVLEDWDYGTSQRAGAMAPVVYFKRKFSRRVWVPGWQHSIEELYQLKTTLFLGLLYIVWGWGTQIDHFRSHGTNQNYCDGMLEFVVMVLSLRPVDNGGYNFAII